MGTPEISARSPRLSDKSCLPFSSSQRLRDDCATAAYKHYLRLPDLSKLWGSKDFPDWRSESILKPALQALEITFRLISIVLSDSRPYANHREWAQRLDSLAAHQIELIATLCEEERPGSGAPVSNLSSSRRVPDRDKSSQSQEVWKLPGATPVVSRTSQASLLPRLATWDKSAELASKILLQIECQMHGCQFTLGLGEPNLAGKPNLDYDLVVRPLELRSVKKSHFLLDSNNPPKNQENQILFTIHQILESWLFSARELLRRVGERIDGEEWEKAASDCWILERVWKLLSEMEDLHVLMDPGDFLWLKSQLTIKATSGSEAFCFRSTALLDITSSSKGLKRRVPWILGVEVDPNGGPRVQEAAMRLFHSKMRDQEEKYGRIHLLQALQAIEAAVKRFYFAYQRLIVAVMGSLEASSNRAMFSAAEPLDSLSQMFLEPPYFPSLDAAKTFLGEYWRKEHRSGSGGGCQLGQQDKIKSSFESSGSAPLQL